MTNNTAISNGIPYLTVLAAGTLNSGASVTVPVQFLNPARGFVNYTPQPIGILSKR